MVPVSVEKYFMKCRPQYFKIDGVNNIFYIIPATEHEKTLFYDIKFKIRAWYRVNELNKFYLDAQSIGKSKNEIIKIYKNTTMPITTLAQSESDLQNIIHNYVSAIFNIEIL